MSRFRRDESEWTAPSSESPWPDGGTTFGIDSLSLNRAPDEPDEIQPMLEHNAEEDRRLSTERGELEH